MPLDDGRFWKPVEVVVSVSEGDKGLNFPYDGELQIPIGSIGMSQKAC